MKYSERIPVLNSLIPQGGRNLTNSECTKIRAAGHSCSTRWSVERAYASSNHGIIYKPCKTGGRDHAGIYVETI